MQSFQPGIPAPLPAQARHLFFALESTANLTQALRFAQHSIDGDHTVLGLGLSLTQALRADIPGLKTFTAHSGPGFEIPSTQHALWCWLRGDDRGELTHRARALEAGLAPAFRPVECVDCFVYDGGKDLTGYVDGTENPQGKKALEAALVSGQGPGRDGSSFVALQKWIHDWGKFEAMRGSEQDKAIGRRKKDNVEMAHAPASAHVKRTAQESFSPEAFLLRRSMPWADGDASGLLFAAFGRSLDAFEAQLRRMIGAEDGIADALFSFTRPVSGGYYWCPPRRGSRLDFSALGL